MKKKKERDIYDELSIQIRLLVFLGFILGLMLGLLIGEF